MLKIGVLRGGPNEHYEKSFSSGDAILRTLRDMENVEVVDLVLTKDRTLLRKGLPISLEKLSREIDMIWNTVFGYYGEDGKIQSLFEHFGIKFVGPESHGASFATNKKIAKDMLSSHGIKTPMYTTVETGNIDIPVEDFVNNEVFRINRKLPPPWIVKPISSGMSHGVRLARSLPELSLAITEAVFSGEDLLVEEYIEGRHFSVGVIDNFRKEDLYSLLPGEVRLFGKGKILDKNMRDGDVCYLFPCKIDDLKKQELMNIAKTAHKALSLRHFSESDFVIHPKRGVYYIETDAIPSLHDGSSFRLSLESVGSSLEDLAKNIIKL